MAAKPVKLKKGGTPTLLHADFANEHVMTPIHALSNMTSSPPGYCKLVMNGESAILDFTGAGAGLVLIVDFNGTLKFVTMTGKIGEDVP